MNKYNLNAFAFNLRNEILILVALLAKSAKLLQLHDAAGNV